MLNELGLFFGSLLDSLIGPNLFVPGEPFLLAAGYQLYQGAIWGVAAVLLGGWIGDQSSYWIGRRSGKRLLSIVTNKRPKTRRSFARARLLMQKHGIKVMLFSRLLGPVSWFVPCLSGTAKVSWLRFTACSTVGLLLGVGQFVVMGYLLASGVSLGIDVLPMGQSLALFVDEHTLAITLVGLFVLVSAVIARFCRRRRAYLIPVFALLCLGLMNYIHFFQNSDDNLDKANLQNQSVSISELEMQAYPGRSQVYKAQMINVVYLGESPQALMQDLGWQENQTFSRHDLELSDYIALIRGKIPPVSDLFWQGEPQLMAFQQPGSLLKRSHIRWWSAGIDRATQKRVWLGALSYDDGLKIAHYSGIITLLHQVDSDVDMERDKLASQVSVQSDKYSTQIMALLPPNQENKKSDYFTDGGVLLVAEPRYQQLLVASNYP
ncbi:mll0121 protein [Vibrio ishigakensis]|uniref:Mll0121 protein n=2 Tax=Vibrio ishigakensis TaxID=1481914 RepID=A0A0B8P3X6_9VIBR|nr:LssY C-terminal domain-containing protein [Vibrio ishigakensis]GAM59292.1 mll0121 protein [Vibrio ishigakensis]